MCVVRDVRKLLLFFLFYNFILWCCDRNIFFHCSRLFNGFIGQSPYAKSEQQYCCCRSGPIIGCRPAAVLWIFFSQFKPSMVCLTVFVIVENIMDLLYQLFIKLTAHSLLPLV